MSCDVETYITQVTQGLLPAERTRVQQELRSDLTRLIDDLRLEGLSQSEATGKALELFGRPEPVAVSFFQVHTLSKFRSIGQAGFLFTALWMLMSFMRTTAAPGSPLLTIPYGCETPLPGTVCLPDRSGWIALDDVQQALHSAGWHIQPRRVTAPDLPGVWNEVIRIRSGAFSLDVPAGPDRLREARNRASGVGFRGDPNILEKDGQTFIRAASLFELLATQTSQSRVNQRDKMRLLQIDEAQFGFPYRGTDPAKDFLWREVGLSLHLRHGLTVAAQSTPRGVQYPISLQVSQPGTVVLVFRHPSGYGAGYVTANRG